MFARIEVAMKPEFLDPMAQIFLRKLELAHAGIHKKLRWARRLDIYWMDLPIFREEFIPAAVEVLWDPVLQWLFSGGLIPAAAGDQGTLIDLLQNAPFRPGVFWGIESRFRPGVTDNVGKTLHEALEIVLGRKLQESRTASGHLLILEGPELTEEDLRSIAQDLICNELIETWTLLTESELMGNNRFHQERIKRDFPKIPFKNSDRVETFPLEHLKEKECLSLSEMRLWAMSHKEMQAIQNYFYSKNVQDYRKSVGLSDPTDVEMEILAQTWSEHCKHKIFSARIHYENKSTDLDRMIPSVIEGLFKTTIAGTTSLLTKNWLLSVFHDNAGILAFDDEDAICIKVETHNSPSALDPYGGALTGIVGVNRDILGSGLGAKPIFNTNVFCLAPPDYREVLPERVLHPRRILDGVSLGVEHGGNKSGIPTVNGALVFDERFLGKPLIFCGTAGILPRLIAGRKCETKEIRPGDQICMVGGRIGKDGIHGATFSSLALTESSPASAVQLGDPITQKRMSDFLLEARDLGFYRAITDNGAGGLSSSVGELAQLSGGAKMDVSLAKIKYPGLKPYELVISESQERMTVAVPPEKSSLFVALANRRAVEVSVLGSFTQTGKFEILYEEKLVGSIDLEFLHKGVPRLELEAQWKGRPKPPSDKNVELPWDGKILLELLARPNIASKEWLIRQYDHEVQGGSVIKPLHTVSAGSPHAHSGPNDAAVVKPKSSSMAGIAVGSGINPKLSDIDPYIMAQSSVDEALRNILCVGADFGRADTVIALVDNFCWPDPIGDPSITAALVRACYGLHDAALNLSVPLISGKDSMKNNFQGIKSGKECKIAVPPTLLMTAIAKVTDIRLSRTADFKSYGDILYILGPAQVGLWGSEFQQMKPEHTQGLRLGEPDWKQALKVYQWIGGGKGKKQALMKSLHDISEGGLLVCVAESLLARGLGAQIFIPESKDLWEFCYGEGFHSFVTSVGESDCQTLEDEWQSEGVAFQKLGSVTATDKLVVFWKSKEIEKNWSVSVQEMRQAWKKEGYWQ